MRLSWTTIGGIGAIGILVAACTAGVIASRATAGNTSSRRGTIYRALATDSATPTANDVSELHVTIKEWDVPTKGAHPHDPAVGMDGALWFTEQMQNKIGRVEPSTGAFKEFPLKVDNSGPHGLVSDADGNIWFTGNFAHYIGKLDTKTGEVKEYMMPDAKAEDPHTAAFDADGILWFTVQAGNFVGRLDPRSGKIDLVTVPTPKSHPYGLQVNSQGIPFFCEFFTNKMASIDPKTLEIKEYALPEGVRPRRMAIDDHDLVYFTDFERGHLGRLNPKTGEVKMWDSPSGAKSQPYGIAITPDGMVWYSESGVQPNTLVRFDPKTEAMARTNIPSGGGTVRNMAATADGRVYIACSGVNKVGVVIPAR
ncbi:MAG TPA: hypothetical protein VJN92_18990 [Candidatus Acidoferrum sp.]|nr:hypothetical protein [Candidatus Acidoferrum sp.]